LAARLIAGAALGVGAEDAVIGALGDGPRVGVALRSTWVAQAASTVAAPPAMPPSRARRLMRRIGGIGSEDGTLREPLPAC
jgi:hypothetical protein